jgi:DNA-binding response OmpR family regulator
MSAPQVRVVVVDDARDSSDTLAELLRLHHYEVWTADSATEALALVDEHKPHCVLFDVVMPGIGGDELCVRLRAAYGDDIVLIAVTGCSEGDPRVDKSFSLADHYFSKPIDPVALSKVLRPLR